MIQPRRVNIRLTPGARTERIVVHPNSTAEQENLHVYVMARAHNDKANHALIAALSTYWSIPPSRICIKRGLKSRDKLILVHPS